MNSSYQTQSSQQHNCSSNTNNHHNTTTTTTTTSLHTNLSIMNTITPTNYHGFSLNDLSLVINGVTSSNYNNTSTNTSIPQRELSNEELDGILIPYQTEFNQCKHICINCTFVNT